MSKKKPNKVVTELEEGQDDDGAFEFQDGILSCLRELQNQAALINQKAEQMEFEIRRFRASIHGEDIDE